MFCCDVQQVIWNYTHTHSICPSLRFCFIFCLCVQTVRMQKYQCVSRQLFNSSHGRNCQRKQPKLGLFSNLSRMAIRYLPIIKYHHLGWLYCRMKMMSLWDKTERNYLTSQVRWPCSLIIDREAGEIIHLVVSVCPSVLSCLNRLSYDLDFWYGDRPWPWLGWDWRSRS